VVVVLVGVVTVTVTVAVAGDVAVVVVFESAWFLVWSSTVLVLFGSSLFSFLRAGVR
jgi:hypothetical protein